MRTGALLPQLPTGKSLGRKGRAEKNKKAIAKAPKAKAKAPKAKTKDPKAKAKAPKAKAKGPLPLAPIGSYRDGFLQLLTPRSAKGKDKARKAIFQDSSDDEDGSSNDSEAAGTVEARRF